MPRTLNQIKNQYANEVGDIGRKYPTDKKAYNQARYQLNASTFFHAYQDFIETTFPEAKKEMEEEKWFVLFRQLVSGCVPDQEPIAGTPAETAICAAIDLELKQEHKGVMSESKRLNKIYNEWPLINIHIALQLAVIELLTNTHKISQKTTDEKVELFWYPIIKTLLSLGADPNYPSDTFRNQLLPAHFNHIPAELSAFHLVMFRKNNNETLRNLASDFFNQQKHKERKLTIPLKLMWNVLPVLAKGWINNFWFKFAEKTFGENLPTYLSESLEAIVTQLEELEDYESIEYLRNEYKLNTFVILVEKTKHMPTLRHLHKNYLDQLEKYLKTDPYKAIQLYEKYRDADIAAFEHFDMNLKKLLINTIMVSVVRNFQKPFIETPWFKYLEKNYPNELNEFLEKNLDRLVDNFLKYDFQDGKSLARLAKFPGIVLPYFQAVYKTHTHYAFTEYESFRAIATYRDEELLRFFRINTNMDLITILEHVYSYSPATVNSVVLTTVYNFDWCRHPARFHYVKSNPSLGTYYQQRANAILDFIFNQKYPLAAGSTNTFYSTQAKEMSHNGKTLKISNALSNIVERLVKVTKVDRTDAASCFKLVYESNRHNNSSTIDQSERDITKALESKLTDESELSSYVEQQFLLHRTNPYLKKVPDEKLERKGP